MAITWRQLTGYDSSKALAGIDTARESINAGFNVLDKTLQREQQAAGKAQEAARNEAQQGYLNLLQGARTVQDLDQLQSSGALDQAFASLDPRVQAQVRAAAEQRRASLMDQTTKGQQFASAQELEAAKPLLSKFQVALQSGDFEVARATQAQLPVALQGKAAEDIRVRNEGNQTFSQKIARDAIGVGQASAGLESTLLGNEQKELANKDANRVIKERDLVDTAVGRALGTLNKETEAATQVAKTLAQQMNLPVDSSGMPDLQALQREHESTPKGTTSRLSAFNIAMDQLGGGQIPSSTVAINNLKKSLQAEGASPRVINTALEQAKGLLTVGTQISPEDNARLQARVAPVEKVIKDTVENNPWYIDPQKAFEDQAKVFNKVNTEMKDGNWTKEALQDQLNDWMNNGYQITTSDGQRVKVKVPPKIMMAGLANAMEANTYVNNETDTRLKKYLDNVFSDPNTIEQRKVADYVMAGRYNKELEDITKNFTKQFIGSSPTTWADDYFKLRSSQNK